MPLDQRGRQSSSLRSDCNCLLLVMACGPLTPRSSSLTNPHFDPHGSGTRNCGSGPSSGSPRLPWLLWLSSSLQTVVAQRAGEAWGVLHPLWAGVQCGRTLPVAVVDFDANPTLHWFPRLQRQDVQRPLSDPIGVRVPIHRRVSWPDGCGPIAHVPCSYIPAPSSYSVWPHSILVFP